MFALYGEQMKTRAREKRVCAQQHRENKIG